MNHFAAKAVRHTVLFRTWEEGHALWARLVAALPGAIAICVMPDHIHVLHRRDVSSDIRRVMAAFARWRNHHRGESGAVWQRLGKPALATTSLKRWRDEKYVHKNPCRAGLTDSPLAWPWSTYRDAVGLALRPVRPKAPDTDDYHLKTCRDDHVRFRELPTGHGDVWGTAGLPAIADAVSSVLRVPSVALRQRGVARTLFVRASRVLTEASAAEIAVSCGISRRQVFRVPAGHDPGVSLVARVLGDARFTELGPGDLLRTPTWRSYARARRIER